ncbi:MAG: hypothetical protein ABFS16_02520 [Bacteroidota bacterium]
MKTKIFLLVCLFMGIAVTQIYAQDKANNAVQGWAVGTYWTPVFCDGEMVDYLENGEIRIHFVYRLFKKGDLIFKEIDQIKGTVTSRSGEVFKIRETDKWSYAGQWIVTWKYNLIGNQGTHYIGTLTYNYATGELTVGKTVCH